MSQINPTTVAIVMGTYNGARFLEEQLASIVSQTYADWHLLIRDDGSTDETPTLLERAAATDSRIEVVHDTQGNLGPALNFSALCEIAKARGFAYLFFADQDDVWNSDKIARSLAALQAEEERAGSNLPLLVHSDLVVVDEHRRLIADSLMRYKHIHHVVTDPLRTLLVQNFVTGCSAACNRALLDVAAPVPPVAIMHDYWFALCAAAFGRLLYVSSSTAEYRQHSGNQLGAKRRTLIPTPSRGRYLRAWREGVAWFERRIGQAHALSEVSTRHAYVDVQAQTTLVDFLDIFRASTKFGRLIRALRRRIRCQRGVGYDALLYAQIMCANT